MDSINRFHTAYRGAARDLPAATPRRGVGGFAGVPVACACVVVVTSIGIGILNLGLPVPPPVWSCAGRRHRAVAAHARISLANALGARFFLSTFARIHYLGDRGFPVDTELFLHGIPESNLHLVQCVPGLL